MMYYANAGNVVTRRVTETKTTVIKTVMESLTAAEDREPPHSLQ